MCNWHFVIIMSVQGWLLDQFGVLHDGKEPYPGAISTCMFSYTTSFQILASFLMVFTV